ncbi:MAG TPA: hypothetical protein VKB16_22790 [Beijerinckiaceae bacterium]|jgi:hypothetical protein|nr:hypothetical protein [Beijerinckiaceae bacterium]
MALQTGLGRRDRIVVNAHRFTIRVFEELLRAPFVAVRKVASAVTRYPAVSTPLV